MKLNFKKIAALLATTAMLGSTIGFASAAWASPFVQNGAGDAAVVYGTNADVADIAAATKIATALESKVTVSTGAAASVSEGDSFKLDKTNSKINLGDSINSVYTSLDKTDLTKVLAAGLYEDDDGEEYDYKQSIALAGTTLSQFADEDVNADEAPFIGFGYSSNQNILNYTLDFTDKPANTSTVFDTSYLEILGVNYYVSSLTNSAGNVKLSLLDSANTATVDSTASKTVTVGDKTYEVEIVSVSEGTTASDNKATLKVNGVKIDSINQGNSRKIADDTYLSIVDVNEASRESDNHQVEFSIGTGKLVLENGQDLVLNDDTIEGVGVTISASSNKINSINLVWDAEEEGYLLPGNDWILPGLESIKLSMSEFVSPETESLKIENSGDDYMLLKNLQVTDGEITTLPILYSNTTKTGFAGLGKDSTHKLVTSMGVDTNLTDGNDGSTTSVALSLNESRDQYFVASWANSANGDDWESYVFELISVNEVDSGNSNETKIKNVATDEETTFADDEDVDFGEINLAVSSQNGDAGTATVTITAGSSGVIYTDRIFTKAGMVVKLPYLNSSAVNGTRTNAITANAGSWTLRMGAQNSDDAIDSDSFNATLGHTTTKGPEIDSIAGLISSELPIEEGSDVSEGYVAGARAVKLLYDVSGDNDKLEVLYPTGESYAKVYVSESAVTFAGADSIRVYTDAQVDTVKDKNLVVVGGSCINTVAAKILGSETPVCGAAFSAKTNVGAGQYLLKVAASPYNAEKLALLIAGYEAADTTTAAAKVAADGTSMEVGETVGPVIA